MKPIYSMLFLLVAIVLPAYAAGPVSQFHVLRPDDSSFLSLSLRTPQNAARVWVPETGSPAPIPAVADGRPFLRLTCPFARTDAPARASWDVSVRLDLTSARGIRFAFRSTDIAPASCLSVYLRSGDGWYAAQFSPRADGLWETFEIDKASMKIEGTPAGWASIDQLRVSVWRGDTRDMAIDVAEFAVAGKSAQLAVIRGLSALTATSDAGERRAITKYAATVTDALESHGLSVALMEDTEVTANRLAPFPVTVLPYNPQIPVALESALVRYVQAGGKIVGFYACPSTKLQGVLGLNIGKTVLARDIPNKLGGIRFADAALPGAPRFIPQRSWILSTIAPVAGRGRVLANWVSGEGKPTTHSAVVESDVAVWMGHVLVHESPEASSQLALAMVGRFLPSAWVRASVHAIRGIGAALPYRSLDDAYQELSDAARRMPPTTRELSEAKALHRQAAQLHGQRRFPEAIRMAHATDARLRDAFYRLQEPMPREFHGVWCHNPAGIQGRTWDTAIRDLRTAGFHAIFANVAWAGATAYRSRLLPAHPVVAESGDQLAACAAACREHGVQLHAWKVMYKLGPTTPEFRERLRKAQRLQAGSSDWLCPSHPDNQALEVSVLAEIARTYPVRGIHLDYIRYPSANSCYCVGCRERFQAFARCKVPNWPAGLAADDLATKWRDFRRANITAVVRSAKQTLREINPALLLSAAVFPDPGTCRDVVAQDWPEWCAKGYLDFVCPMNYCDSEAGLEAMLAKQTQAIRSTRVPIVSGIGVSTDSLDAVDVIGQVKTVRRHRASGFLLFEYDARVADEVIPHLGKGITNPR